jgi:hypothetical protein
MEKDFGVSIRVCSVCYYIVFLQISYINCMGVRSLHQGSLVDSKVEFDLVYSK